MYSKGFDNYKNINILLYLKLYAVNIFTMMRSNKIKINGKIKDKIILLKIAGAQYA